jgi:gluconate kinase
MNECSGWLASVCIEKMDNGSALVEENKETWLSSRISENNIADDDAVVVVDVNERGRRRSHH